MEGSASPWGIPELSQSSGSSDWSAARKVGVVEPVLASRWLAISIRALGLLYYVWRLHRL